MKIKNCILSCLLAVLCCFPIVKETKIFNIFDNISNVKSVELTDNVVATDELMSRSNKSNLTEYNNYLQAYFDSLTYNFGLNYKGTCGYIAIGMLLSYYDTYLSDEIVPEKYDVASVGDDNIIKRRNSPGTLYDNIRIADNVEYYSALSALSENCLHSKLVTIGVANEFCDIEKAKYGTFLSQRIQVVNNYLSETVGYNENNQYKIEYIDHEADYKQNSDKVKDYVKSKIKDGYPVLISIVGKLGGHACIAYDYDSTSDEIYCHMGWGASTTHVTIESQEFQYYRSAMIIDFNMPHTHSNNYIINGKEYCYCTDEVEIYHNHKYSYENTDISFHTKTCECGLTKTEYHSHRNYSPFVILNGKASPVFHKANCVCGHFKRENHSLTTIKYGVEDYTFCTKCYWSEMKEVIIDRNRYINYEQLI